MQTFLPYPDIRRSIRVLDDRRVWKQAVEAWQILRALQNPANAWNRHPTVKMWRGYEQALIAYYNEALAESARRGIVSVRLKRILRRGRYRLPHWWGGPIHASHRSNLLRKNPAFYRRYRWREPPDLPYVWPVR